MLQEAVKDIHVISISHQHNPPAAFQINTN